MKTTLTLHWKALVNKIHPPLPLTPRDSQRLLNALNASFRQTLDQHHPTKEDHYTNDHLHSVLSSPLLLNNNLMSQRLVGDSRVKRAAVHNEAPMQDPVATMQDMISKGKATLETMKRCLIAQLKQSLTTADPKLTMKNSYAGSITLHWLWAAGMANSLKFLPDQIFTQHLIKFLVAEGQHDKIYEWLDLYSKKLQEVAPTNETKRILGRIILELTKAEVTFGEGASSALTIFVKILNEWHQAGIKPKYIYRTFSPSGNYLMSIVEAKAKAGHLATGEYTELQRSANLWTEENAFERAWLSLHHPERPCVDFTLPFLQNLSPKTLIAMSRRRRINTVDLSLQAAERLLSENNRADVALIMNVLRTHFPEEIGYEACPDTRTSTREDATPLEEGNSVRMLESLAAS